MTQNAYVVTEDRVNAFNNYSFEFQIYLGLFFTTLGVSLGNIDTRTSTVFITASILTIVLFGFLIWSWLKFKKIRKSLFIKSEQIIDKIIIKKAMYGKNDTYIDIADKIIPLIENDKKLEFLITNEVAGEDPLPGIKKEFIITYQFRGEEISKKYIEGDEVILP